MRISLSGSRVRSARTEMALSGKFAVILLLASAIPMPAIASDPVPAQVAAKASPSKSDPFAQQVSQLRANSCGGLYAALGNAAVAGSKYAVRSEADRTAPNAHAVSGTVGMTYDLPAIKGAAAALVSARPVGNKCEGQFVRIVPFQVSCSSILRDFPAGTKPIGDLSGVPFYQLGGDGGQALTIPSGETCVVVSIVQGQQKL